MYKNKKINKIRWSFGEINPTDTITKKTPNRVLNKFININLTFVQIKKWVKELRDTEKIRGNSV